MIVPSAAVPQWYDVVDFEWSSMAAMPAAVFIPTKNRKACAPPPLAVEPAMMSAHAKDESGWSLRPGGNAPARREPVSEGDCLPPGNEFRRKPGSLGLSIDFFEVEPARPSAQEMPNGANIRNFRVWMTHSIPTETPQYAKFGRYVTPKSETWYPVTHLSGLRRFVSDSLT